MRPIQIQKWHDNPTVFQRCKFMLFFLISDFKFYFKNSINACDRVQLCHCKTSIQLLNEKIVQMSSSKLCYYSFRNSSSRKIFLQEIMKLSFQKDLIQPLKMTWTEFMFLNWKKKVWREWKKENNFAVIFVYLDSVLANTLFHLRSKIYTPSLTFAYISTHIMIKNYCDVQACVFHLSRLFLFIRCLSSLRQQFWTAREFWIALEKSELEWMIQLNSNRMNRTRAKFPPEKCFQINCFILALICFCHDFLRAGRHYDLSVWMKRSAWIFTAARSHQSKARGVYVHDASRAIRNLLACQIVFHPAS